MEQIIQNETGFEIAVVGMSGRFPGAKNLDEFWENLKAGKESIRFFTDEELREYDVADESLENPNYIKAKGYIENADVFDARFFGYTPEEALKMDPQIRIFHECVWHALEDAGYYPTNYRGQIGLYGGGFSSSQWQETLRASHPDRNLDFATELLSSKDLMTTRVSYNLGLTGPSFSVNTQCSTSLVAIHLACSALVSGECDIALAGGVSLMLPPKTGFEHIDGFIISSDGHCRPFDAKANGTIWGDGVGIVALKRLRSAINDGDLIHAIIKGSAINNDGNNKSTYTSPSIAGQSDVIKLAHQFAEIDPNTIEYVETHGTGTSLGDPIEVEALKRCFNTDKKRFCGIGSVKSNIGHLVSAAGVASFIKTVLALKNKQIPPSINYDKPNPKIDFENSPFYVVNELKNWDTQQKARRAAVSSFGIGGTNAHLVLEESPVIAEQSNACSSCSNTLVLSARSPQALEALLPEYQALVANEQTNLNKLAFSTQTAREPFEYRAAIPFESRTDLTEKLNQCRAQEVTHLKAVPRMVFMFPGQGAQYPSMCRDLYTSYEVFKTEFDHCCDLVAPLGTNLYSLVFKAKADESRINETHYTQLVLFAVEYALAKLLMSLGIKPAALIGHSLGEYVAATIAGVISLEDALRLVDKRGRLMQSMERGSMVSVMTSSDALRSLIDEKVAVACLNSSELMTLSGKTEDIDSLCKKLKQNSIPFSNLKTSHAFHSALMDPMVEEFEREVEKIRLSAPTIPYISNLTGTWITKQEATNPKYYGKQLRQSVNFEAGVATLIAKSINVFIEVGPGNALSTFVKRHSQSSPDQVVMSTVRKPKEALSDQQKFLEVISELWKQGVNVNFPVLYGDCIPSKIKLPLYPFQGKQYWPKATANPLRKGASIKHSTSEDNQAPYRVNNWFYEVSWQKSSTVLAKSLHQQPSKWLVLLDNKPWGNHLAERLRQENQEVVFIYPADEYAQADGQYAINITQEDDFAKVLQSERKRGNTFDIIVNALLMEEKSFEGTDTPDISHQLFRCFYSNIHLVRACAKVSADQKLKLITVTNGTYEVTGNERLNPFHSLAISTVKVVPSEYSNITCKLLDVARDTSFDHLTEQLIEEAFTGNLKNIVAYRNNIRWEQTYVHRPPRTPNIKSIQIKEDGVYMITGGLGIFGFKFSEYLRKHNRVRLALLTRSAFPKKEYWKTWNKYALDALLIHSTYPDELGMDQAEVVPETCRDIHNKISKLLALEASGVDANVYQAVLSDPADLRQCVATIEKELGSINGVIHGAGLYHYTPVATATYDAMNAIFQPKVHGTLALYEAIKDKKIDFFMFHSSLSAVVPLKHFTAYSGANLFLDGFAAYLNTQSSLRTIAVNWDIFKLTESEIGAVTQEEQKNSQAHMQFLKDGITHEEGREVFDKLLHEYVSQVIVSRNDLFEIQTVIDAQHAEVSTQNDQNNAHFLATRPDLLTAYLPPETSLEEEFCALWQTVLGYNKVGLNDNFFELGGDSLQALTLIGRMNKKFSLDLTISDFFKRPTIQSLVAHITKAPDETGGAGNHISIKQAPVKALYELSSAQRRIYLLHKLDEASLAYNLPQLIRLEGALDKARLSEAFRQLIARHEILRTAFLEVEGKPWQKILENVPFEIEEITFNSDTDEAIKNFIRPFDLGTPPLLRVGLMQVSEQEHLMLIDIHHIITDGVSQGILIQDFMALYEEKNLSKLRLQYKDYSEWQQSTTQQQYLAAQREFWKGEFAEEVSVLDLPTDFPRPTIKSHAGSIISFTIGREETRKMKAVGEQEGATIFMTLLAIFNVFLSKLSNQSDITIGTGVAGRNHTDVESILGMFVNTLALRNFPKGEVSFNAFLAEVKRKALFCFDNQSYPYEELVEELNIPRDTGRNPLTDVMLVFQNFGLKELSIPGLTLTPYGNINHISKFDLTLTAAEADDQLYIEFEYSTDLFERQTIERFISYFRRIVEEVTSDADKKLYEIDIVSAEERRQLVCDFNQTATDYAINRSVTTVFEEQVRQTPYNIALVHDDQEVTYEALNNRANWIAHKIAEHGSVAHQKVALLLSPSIDFIASLLGILKCGGTYVPLSVGTPVDRLRHILSDCDAKLLLTQSDDLETEVASAQLSVASLSINYEDRPEKSYSNPERHYRNEDALYVIYTSGSTGLPKGVEVSHSGVLNTAIFYKELFDVRENTKMSQVANVSFDATALETWPCLLHGATLYIAPPPVRLDPVAMYEWIQDRSIEVTFQVPAIAEGLLRKDWDESCCQLRGMSIGGDKLNYFPRYSLPFKIYNLYGPTEDSIVSTYSEVIPGHEQAQYIIGSPIANKQVYVVDDAHNLQPKGVIGELCVAGVGVANRYLNHDRLTREKFVENPFEDGNRMYKTGDLARRLPDGRIEFIGRKDNQVKLRGYRIELGEIEHLLSSRQDVESALVMVTESKGEKYLVAYYLSEQEDLTNQSLLHYLSESLPDYMLPTFFVRMDQWPLTANGKIDRSSLPVPEFTAEGDYAPPSSEVEYTLVTIWSEVLALEKEVISVNRNFFELGGNSRKIIQLKSLLDRQTNLDITVMELFRHTTISSLVEYINQRDGKEEALFAELDTEVSEMESLILNLN